MENLNRVSLNEFALVDDGFTAINLAMIHDVISRVKKARVYLTLEHLQVVIFRHMKKEQFLKYQKSLILKIQKYQILKKPMK